MTISIDEFKDLVDFMKLRGVDKFTYAGACVEFSMNQQAPKELDIGETPSEQLSNIKETLKRLKTEAETDELWSV